MGCSAPIIPWDKTVPNPTSQAFTWTINSFEKSGPRSTGPLHRISFNFSKEAWHAAVKRITFEAEFFMRSVKGQVSTRSWVQNIDSTLPARETTSPPSLWRELHSHSQPPSCWPWALPVHSLPHNPGTVFHFCHRKIAFERDSHQPHHSEGPQDCGQPRELTPPVLTVDDHVIQISGHIVLVGPQHPVH